jgi:hypothetical protein
VEATTTQNGDLCHGTAESERFLQELRAAGRESLRSIAAGLEERGIPAARGGKWSAVQVARLLEAAAVPFGVSAAAAVA